MAEQYDDLQQVLGYKGHTDGAEGVRRLGDDVYAVPFWTPEYCATIIRAAEASEGAPVPDWLTEDANFTLDKILSGGSGNAVHSRAGGEAPPPRVGYKPKRSRREYHVIAMTSMGQRSAAPPGKRIWGMLARRSKPSASRVSLGNSHSARSSVTSGDTGLSDTTRA